VEGRTEVDGDDGIPFLDREVSTLATYWMPALLTSISTPNVAGELIMASISAGLVMSALWYSTLTPNSLARSACSLAIFAVAKAVQQHVGAFRRQRAGDAQADAGGGSGNQRGLAAQSLVCHTGSSTGLVIESALRYTW
jgi:hypothetical protein